MTERQNKRCAIYTRKSHEDGLDKEFNSLEAQREVCEAAIRAKAHERWTIVAEEYNDGGFSGGNIDRPGLERLLEDIRDGRIDIVVVYKIDRLSRSMFDFLGMMRFFEEHGVSFVSATQDFNTETAMGRLMLNILQSFAQFEREVTSERIRDKLAASKKKGMWTGGIVPLGYDAIGRKLVVNEEEAERVRYIFQRYCALGSATALMRDLKAKNVTTKSWTSARGRFYPPKPFAKSSLYRILSNPVYIGKIRHKARGRIYEGQHTPIIDETLWNTAQEILSGNTAEKIRFQSNKDRPYLLKGIVENPNGYAMTPSCKRKKDRVYRYYVSIQAIKNGAESCPVKTVPAQALEEIVLARVKKILTAPEWIKKLAETTGQELKLPDINACLERFDAVWDELFPVEQARIVHLLVEKVTVRPDGIVLKLRPAGFVSVLQDIRPELDLDRRAKATTDTPLAIDIPAILRRQAGRKFIKAPDGSDLAASERPRYDDALIKALVRAHDWQGRLDSGKARSVKEIGEAEGLGETYVRNIVRLTELAPDITAAILNGRQPASLTLSQIRAVPLLWDEQRRAFGFTA